MTDIESAVRSEVVKQIMRFLPPDVGDQSHPDSIFLLHFGFKPGMDEPGGPMSWRSNAEILKSLWCVTSAGSKQLPVDVRETLENGPDQQRAIVSLWVSSDATEAYISWWFGPFCGHGVRYKVRAQGDAVSLEDEEQCWVS